MSFMKCQVKKGGCFSNIFEHGFNALLTEVFFAMHQQEWAAMKKQSKVKCTDKEQAILNAWTKSSGCCPGERSSLAMLA